MERLTSTEQYKELLLQYKQICRRGYTNNFLNMEMVARYISLGRIYYVSNEDSLLFITDEENYYRLYMQLSPMAEGMRFPKMDKPVLIRNIYRADNRPQTLLDFETMLREQDFRLYDESVQIIAYPVEIKEVVQDKFQRAISFLERAGIRLGYAKKEHADEIMRLRESEPLLKDYHFTYETEDEILNNIEQGYYRCAFDAEGNVCAAQQFSVENGTVQGNWLAVKEEYKVRYGIGTAMAYHSFLYAIERELPTYFGWVVRDNEKSIRYHQAIGYQITDKYADEWVLE